MPITPSAVRGVQRVAENPQEVARLVSPLYAPQTTTESAVTGSKTLLNALGNPEAEALSRLRYDTAASPSLTKNVSTRQGAWNADGVMEYNPMYVAKAPRTLNVGENQGLLKDLAQTATNLEQDGAAITRATPLPWGDMSKGNAAILTNNGKALTAEQIKKLGSAFTDMDGVVLQHRADGEGLVFSGYGDHSMDSIVKKINETVPGLKIKPALSSEGVDRAYMTKQEYPDYGAIPRNINPNGMKTEDIDAILKAMGYRD